MMDIFQHTLFTYSYTLRGDGFPRALLSCVLTTLVRLAGLWAAIVVVRHALSVAV